MLDLQEEMIGMAKIIQYSGKKKQKKGSDSMCKLLEYVRGKKPQEILSKYNQNNTIPVKIEEIIGKIGISVIPKDFTDIENQQKVPAGTILGALASKGDNTAIFYKSDGTYNRRRFTVAHEFAHAMLMDHDDDLPHIKYRTAYMENVETDSKIDWKLERQANIYVGELLIPLML